MDAEPSEGDSLGGYWDNYGYSSYEELIDAVRHGVMIMEDDGNLIQAADDSDAQYQARSERLTDREVLSYAAGEMDPAALNEAERSALEIFQGRLTHLEELQQKRQRLGVMYREQQFSKPADRDGAVKTLARMKEMDRQIDEAGRKVLDVEQKEVLRQVLKRARGIVEKEQKSRDDQTLKRWRDRRRNADTIRKYRERIGKDVGDLTDWTLRPDNKNAVKHLPEALRKTVIPFLSGIDLSSKQYQRSGKPTQADERFFQRLDALKKAMTGQSGQVDELYADFADLPPDFMEKLNRFASDAQEIARADGSFNVNRMTAEELKNLSEVVRNLKTFVQNFNRFHQNAMFGHVDEAGDSTVEELADMKPAKHSGKATEFLFWQHMRPAYVFERFGRGGVAIYKELTAGQAKLAFNAKEILAFAKDAYTPDEVRSWEKDVREITLSNGETIHMTIPQIMSFYELCKREQALGHILDEGIRVATFKHKQKYADTGHRLTDEDLNAIVGQLNDRQKKVADELQKFMQEKGGAWGNHVSMARFGEKQFGEEHYFPIHSDGRHLADMAEEHPQAASMYALLNMGFTKQLRENARNRIVIYSIFDVFSNHMASMAQYNAMALPVVDALKWFNYQQKEFAPITERPADWEQKYSSYFTEAKGSFQRVSRNKVPDWEPGKYFRMEATGIREEMDRVYGVAVENTPGSGNRGYAQRFVAGIIRAYNGTEAQGTPYDNFGLKALHRYNRAQVAFNLRSAIQQPLAVVRAAQILDGRSVIRGMKLSPKAIRKNIEEMERYSGIAAWKGLGFYDVNISRGLTTMIKQDESLGDKVTDAGMWAAEKADLLTWAAMWSAAKEDVILKQGMKPGQDGFYEAVSARFEEVVYKTQVVDSVLTKSAFMRDKGFFARASGTFMSEPVATASMVLDAYDRYQRDLQRGMSMPQAWKKNGRNIARTIAVYAVGQTLLAAVQSIPDAWRDDDEYQEYWEKWLEAFRGNVLEELIPFNKLPIVSDFYEVIKEILSQWTELDVYGNAPQSVYMQWYDVLVKGSVILHDKVYGEETSYTWYGVVYKLLQALSGMTGLPFANVTREIIGIWNNTVVQMAPSLRVVTPYDPGQKKQIQYAYKDGWLTDEEAVAALTDEEALAVYDEEALSEEDARAKVEYWKFTMENPDLEIAEASLTKWRNELEYSGLTVEEYQEFLALKKAEGDDLKKEDILKIINKMKITSKQKDALYRAQGYAESTIGEAPWH